MAINVDRGGPRPRRVRKVRSAESPTEAVPAVDCTDAETASVAAKFTGKATHILVQLEAEINAHDTNRYLIGDPFTLAGNETFGSITRVDHAGVLVRVRALSTTPYALGVGTPSPLQTKLIGEAITGVGAYGSWCYVVSPTSVKRYLRRDWSEDTSWTLDVDAANTAPGAMWAGADRIYLLGTADNKLYAHGSDGSRVAANDIALAADNVSPSGVFSDETSVWVYDSAAKKFFGYAYDTGVYDAGRDFAGVDECENGIGCASDGTTVWVVDSVLLKTFAYTLATGAREDTREVEGKLIYPNEFSFAKVNENWAATTAQLAPYDIAIAGGDTILVSDSVGEVVYAYGLLEGFVELSVKAGPRRVA